MSSAVFYDFETSTTHTAGQILNYAFIEVDSDLKERSRLTGEIRISRLELPSPGAILANRVNVLEHQQRAVEAEPAVMQNIREYLAQVAGRARGVVPLIGYNSNRFDIRHLRTGFIRCGLNPFNIRGLVFYDLFSIVRRLASLCDDFPIIRRKEDDQKLTLSLEAVTRELGLLAGAQTHESVQDVLLSIELARALRDKFGVDIWRSAPYECGDREAGTILSRFEPEYDLTQTKRHRSIPMMLLIAEGSGRLWVNLERFGETPDATSISWFTRAKSEFITDGVALENTELRSLAKEAMEKFLGLTIGKYFQRSTCDIELDIHRIDVNGIDMLYRAIWEKARTEALHSPDPLRHADLLEVFRRFRLKDYVRGGKHDERFLQELKAYAQYRYGGGMIFSRNGGEEGEGESRERHSTLQEMFTELETGFKEGTKDDQVLLAALREFYLKSEIVEVAGELLPSGVVQHTSTPA